MLLAAKRFVFLALICGLALMPATGVALADDDNDDPRVLQVTATGKIAATPDMVIITSGVVTQAKTAREALSQNTTATAAMIAELKAAGIENRDIQTAGLSVQPRYAKVRKQSNDEPTMRDIVGYTVTNDVRVRIRDLSRAGTILDAVVGVGANRMHGLQFAVSNADDLAIKAEADAVKRAKDRAEAIAEAAGIELGRILTIADSARAAPVRQHYSRAMAMAEAVPIQAGEQEISATVTIRFEIRDR